MPNQEIEIITNYSEIVDSISKEILFVWQTLVANGDEATKKLFASIKQILISDEQMFRKQEESNTLKKDSVYIVVKFGGGPSNFGSAVAPISLYALGVANKVKPVQLILGTFVSYWTTKYLGEGTEDVKNHMLQVWNTPEVVSNFNVVDISFRNLYKVTGNIVIGPHAVRLGVLTYFYKTPILTHKEDDFTLHATTSDLVEHTEDGTTYYSCDIDYPASAIPISKRDWETVKVEEYETQGNTFYKLNVTFDKINGVFKIRGETYLSEIDENIYIEYSYDELSFIEGSEKIPFMAFQKGYHASMDSQPFGNTGGFAVSEVNFSTSTFTISTYLLDNQISRDMLAVDGFRYRPNGVYKLEEGKSSAFSPNDLVKVGLEFGNGFTNMLESNESKSVNDPVKGSDIYMRYKILDVQISQELADITKLVIAFTR